MKNAMEYKGYFGTVEYSETDNILFGKVIGIESLISYEGRSVDEMRRVFDLPVTIILNCVPKKGLNLIKHIRAALM